MSKTKPCIAVVDDETSVRTGLDSLLRAAGYHVVLFESGNDFLASLFRGQLPDCVILDCAMPGLSGLDVVSIMTLDRIDVPAIMMSGHADADLENRSIEAGARTLLRKPFGADQLFAAIESGLAQNAQAARLRATGSSTQRAVSRMRSRRS